MKEEKQLYDSFCLQDKCFQEQNSFFRFHPDNQHISQGHQVKEIHPMTFYHLFNKKNKESTLAQIDYSGLVLTLNIVIDSAVSEIGTAIKEAIFQRYIILAEQEVSKWKNLNATEFENEIRQGNFTYLGLLKNIQKEGTQSTMKAVQKNIDRSLEEIYHQIQNKKGLILKQLINLNLQFQDKKDKQMLMNIESVPEKEQITNFSSPKKKVDEYKQPKLSMCIEDMEVQKEEKQGQSAIKLEHGEPVRDSFSFWASKAKESKKMQQEEEIQDEEDEDIDSQSSERQKQSNSNPQKTKTIEKQKIKKKKPKMRINNEEIHLINGSEIVIKQVYTQITLFKKISSLCSHVTAFHIFDQKFLSKTILQELFQKYPKIQVFTINCSIDYRYLKSIPQESIANFKRLCFRWDLQNFYQEYFLQKYFPTKEHLQLKQKKAKSLICEQIQPKALKSNHLILLSNKQIRIENDTKQYNQHINSLQIAVGELKSIIYKDMNNLTHLKITGEHQFSAESKKYILDDENITFLLQKNPQLKSVFLHNIRVRGTATFFSSQPNHIRYLQNSLAQIGKLSQLKVFSLGNEAYPVVINASSIKRLKHIQCLSLQNIQFLSENENHLYHILTILKNFEGLKQLSLNKCKQITSQTLQFLSPLTLKTLQFVSLGHTNIDGHCIDTLAKISNLKSLSLQQTPISGVMLLNMFELFYNYEEKQHPLRHLNIKAKMFNWKLRSFDIIKKLKNQGSSAPPEELLSVSGSIKEQKSIASIHASQKQAPNRLFAEYISTQKTMDEKLMKIFCQYSEGLPKPTEQEMKFITKYKSLYLPEDIYNMHVYTPDLEYLNICNNLDLSDVDFSLFNNLKVLSTDKFIHWNGKIKEGVKVVTEGQSVENMTLSNQTFL